MKTHKFSALPLKDKYLLLDSLRNLCIPYKVKWDKAANEYVVITMR